MPGLEAARDLLVTWKGKRPADDASEQGLAIHQALVEVELHVAMAKAAVKVELERPLKRGVTPGVTDKMIRDSAAKKLKKCGKNGRIELTAALVASDGRLLKPRVTVVGEAAKDPAVKACAEQVVKRLRFLPSEYVMEFLPLAVEI